jgi:ribosome-binding factor A
MSSNDKAGAGDAKFRRVSRVEKTLREIIAQHLSANLQLFEGALVSVVRVMSSQDLRGAEVYISVYGGDEYSEDLVFDILDEQRPMIQHKIAKELPMKFCPVLKFVHDDSIDKLVHVSKILNADKKSEFTAEDPSENEEN